MRRPSRPGLLATLLLVGAAAAFADDRAPRADIIQRLDGTKIEVAPLADFPGSAPNFAAVVECEPLAKPGQLLKVPGAEIQSIQFFETAALAAIEQALQSPDADAKAGADKLQAALKNLEEAVRAHESRRSRPPLGINPWKALQEQLDDKLLEARRHLLDMLGRGAAGDKDWTEALRLADPWLDGPLREQVRTLWIRYGEARLKDGDLAGVRRIWDRLEEHFLPTPQAEPLSRALQTRAGELGKHAKDLEGDAALRKLEEALAIWPRTPGLRDELEKLKKTYRVLYVGVRHLPENLSPATAWTNAERQALDLLFGRLVRVRFDARLGQTYEADLARALPRALGARRQVQLRRDVFWSDGNRLTSADVRHTVQLLGKTALGRELVEVPRLEGDFAFGMPLRQALLDPLMPLQLYVLPEKYRGRQLASADDPEFARDPVGSGPFRYVGHKKEGARTVAVFQANPHFDRGRKYAGTVREIRMLAWSERTPDAGQPAPHVLLDVSARAQEALKKIGLAKLQSVPGRRIYFLAVNHRVPALANEDLRRALAHAIPRSQILQDHFRGPETPATLLQPLSGPFPATCWAACPPPRVPLDPYQPDLAKALARKAGQDLGKIRLTLKFPAEEPGVGEACADIARQAATLFADSQASLTLELVPLGPKALRAALHDRDYELAYHSWDFPDDNYWVWPLFDPHPDAVRNGGSNFLGYDNDAKLQSLLRSTMSHRHFPTVRTAQGNVHAHVYQRMPLIPLWQLPEHFAVHPSVTTPALDPRQVFAEILEWKVP